MKMKELNLFALWKTSSKGDKYHVATPCGKLRTGRLAVYRNGAFIGWLDEMKPYEKKDNPYGVRRPVLDKLAALAVDARKPLESLDWMSGK